jgi:hypothetical protein
MTTTTRPIAALLSVEESQVKPGLVAFLVVLAMAVALYFLLRSMSKHLRRIDVDRDRADGDGREPRDGRNG